MHNTMLDLDSPTMMQRHDLKIKILTIGESTVGKTCLLHQYTNKTFSTKTILTSGIDVKNINIKVDDKYIKMQCWDTSGQERFRSITASYYRNSQGIILVYDITNKQSFQAIDTWVKDVDQYAGGLIDIILVGNKSDLPNRKVSREEGEDLARRYQIPFFETSAKLRTNVDEVFQAIAKDVKDRLMENDKDKDAHTVQLVNPGEARSLRLGCC